MTNRFTTEWLNERMERLRLHLAHTDALVALALVGLVSGLLAGAVIVLFRLAVEGTQRLLLPGDSPENYEGLPWWLRLLLPVTGGLLVGLLFERHAKGQHVLGVARVMERLAYHQGYLTLRGFVLQFVGAAVTIVSGHSVGREGPHVFLGAASASLFGQYLMLPNNSIRTLVGCGTAAGIAASFNTPLAGVIFALEVVMMEYTLASFTPVILAAVSANAVSIAVFGNAPSFAVPPLQFGSLAEMPLVLLLGVAAGAVAAGLIHLLQWFTRATRTFLFWWRTTLAGLLVGLCGVLVPEVMGIGYDSAGRVLLGELGLGLLAAMLIFKLVATAVSVGMGMPAGMISPSLFLGAALGGLFGIAAEVIYPVAVSGPGFYALLGMGAVMGASIQAPLAALTAILELTSNPEAIMPGMLAIVIAGLTASQLFHKESLFIAVLKANGLDYSASPVMQALRRVGVAGVMSTRFQRVPQQISRERAERLLQQQPEWLLIDRGEMPDLMFPAVDLARHIHQPEAGTDPDEAVDLIAIPANRLQMVAIHLQATLQEALERLERTGAEALYVERMNVPGIRRIYGVLTREQIDSAYSYVGH